MNTKLMFSSKTPEWETPKELFDELNKEFNFELDTCANYNNKKCNKFIGVKEDGLKVDWLKNGWNWCNPPYGREVGKWIKKASENKKVVLLLPARTDTKWFHDFIYNKAEIRFLKGRLKFGGCANSAPFPSMVVIFK